MALKDSNGRAPEIALLVAEALTATRQYEDSAATLRLFLELHPDHPQAEVARRWLARLKDSAKIKEK